MRRTRSTPWAVAVLAGGLAGGLGAAEQPAGLIRSGEPPTLDLLYTGDVIGYLDPCG